MELLKNLKEIQKYKCIISDLDGTLLDTFEANYRAYSKAFYAEGLSLSGDDYRECFGLGFEDFAKKIGLQEPEKSRIKQLKAQCYSEFFSLIQVNRRLWNILEEAHRSGTITVLASTASKVNLDQVCRYFNLGENLFNLVLTGNDVKNNKPDPEIYETAMQQAHVSPSETLIFEDSEVGLEAAVRSGATVFDVLQWTIKYR